MLNPDEAPPGCRAVKGTNGPEDCRKCARSHEAGMQCNHEPDHVSCISIKRVDRTPVYYVKKSKYPSNL
jgi:hypothetical protein